MNAATMGTRQSKTALVVGAGSLGGPAALTLAAAGVARIVLVDAGTVGPDDLPADTLFVDSDVGQPRGAAAARRLGQLFPLVEVAWHAGPAGATLAGLVGSADVVVDASNDFDAMFAVNDAAVSGGRVVVHGGLRGLTAQLLTLVPRVTGCLRCLFEGPPPPVPPAGMAGPLAGLVGSLLGAEAVRLLDERPGTYAGRLLLYEARPARARMVPVKPRPGCAACGSP
jgi:molybdopterin/thiamine biosynthesis adenylyltransferase